MARHRVPHEVLKARGSLNVNPGRYAGRELEPVPAAPLGPPPEWLNDGEKKAWADLVDILPPRVAYNSDRIALERLCVLLARARTGHIKSTEQNLILAYLSRFGLTPADRTRIQVAPEPPEDAWTEFFPQQ